jgi:hypothetical protein
VLDVELSFLSQPEGVNTIEKYLNLAGTHAFETEKEMPIVIMPYSILPYYRLISKSGKDLVGSDLEGT